MARLIHRLLPAGVPRRLLDFGCGAGGFLLEAKRAGFETMGLGLNRDLAAHVECVHAISVYQGLIEAPGFVAERFGVIVSSQVFEHLLDPVEMLRQLRQHLTPSGLLVTEVPNLHDSRERLWRGSTMDDAHLFYYSRRSLTRLLVDGGFRIVRIDEGLRPYRFFGDRMRQLPFWMLTATERLMSVCQIKTVLSIVAQLK
jgi:SAM-dependent methyltransferase